MLENLFKEMDDFYNKNIKITEKEKNKICEETKLQSKDEMWFLYKKNRISASKCGEICKKRESTHCRGLVIRLLYADPSNLENIEELKYGLEMEEIGRNRYEMLTGNKIELSGFHIEYKKYP